MLGLDKRGVWQRGSWESCGRQNRPFCFSRLVLRWELLQIWLATSVGLQEHTWSSANRSGNRWAEVLWPCYPSMCSSWIGNIGSPLWHVCAPHWNRQNRLFRRSVRRNPQSRSQKQIWKSPSSPSCWKRHTQIAKIAVLSQWSGWATARLAWRFCGKGKIHWSKFRGQKRHINIWYINKFPVTRVTDPAGRVPGRQCLCSLGSAHSTPLATGRETVGRRSGDPPPPGQSPEKTFYVHMPFPFLKIKNPVETASRNLQMFFLVLVEHVLSNCSTAALKTCFLLQSVSGASSQSPGKLRLTLAFSRFLWLVDRPLCA